QKNDDNYQTEYDEDESDSNCSIAQQANNMEDKAMSNEQAIFQINDDSNEGSSSSIATSVKRIVLPKHPSSKTNQLAKVIQKGNKTVMQKLNNIEKLLKDQQKPEDNRPEREQKDRYLTHLRKLLQVSKYRKLKIYDASKNNNFLSMSADILPTRLIGTTNIAIVDRVSISIRIPQNHIWVLFELKKSINDSCMYQALAELTAGKAVALIQKNMKFSNCEQTIEMAEEPKRTKLKDIMNISQISE
ncbi:40089_t:CDS:2, partial [Gigaspora margarita]